MLHATDTGLVAPHSSRPAPAVAADAEALLGAALAAGNLDVAAELLWTWPMLGLPLSPGARYALGELGRAEGTHGFLPGPEHDTGVAAALAPAERSTYVVQTSYHTAVVAGILAAALLRRGAPGIRPRQRDTDRPRRGPPPAPAARRRPVGRPPEERRAVRTRGLHPARARCRAAHRCRAPRPRPRARGRRVGGRARLGHLPSVRQGAALLTRVARAAAQPLTVAC